MRAPPIMHRGRRDSIRRPAARGATSSFCLSPLRPLRSHPLRRPNSRERSGDPEVGENSVDSFGSDQGNALSDAAHGDMEAGPLRTAVTPVKQVKLAFGYVVSDRVDSPAIWSVSSGACVPCALRRYPN